jgi:hypothetical protein
MGDLIDRDAFRADWGFAEKCADCKRDKKWNCDRQMYSARDICGWLDDAPAFTEEAVRKGVWYMGPDSMWTCSECGQTWEVGDGWMWRFNYCPHCGAKNVEDVME